VEHALKELIDNAWDADAENVYIHLPDSLDPEVRFITVVDDGIGMSSENIKSDYMHIARNRLVLGGDRTKIKINRRRIN
jgi:DNA mismatch repair ATPase MutL